MLWAEIDKRNMLGVKTDITDISIDISWKKISNYLNKKYERIEWKKAIVFAANNLHQERRDIFLCPVVCHKNMEFR